MENLSGVAFVDSTTGWAISIDGTILHTTNGGVTFIEEYSGEQLTNYTLSNNYPNPFNPNTKIKYTIPQVSFVSIRIFNVLLQTLLKLNTHLL